MAKSSRGDVPIVDPPKPPGINDPRPDHDLPETEGEISVPLEVYGLMIAEALGWRIPSEVAFRHRVHGLDARHCNYWRQEGQEENARYEVTLGDTVKVKAVRSPGPKA